MKKAIYAMKYYVLIIHFQHSSNEKSTGYISAYSNEDAW